jgi:mannitol-1-phosphate/altronate dehydrogenase
VVRADLADPSRPGSALGYIVEALDRRRRSGLPPFTVLSCDNLPGNGIVARKAVIAFARLRDAVLADWIDEHAAFPSSMVDRITPMTTDADREMVERTFGVGRPVARDDRAVLAVDRRRLLLPREAAA